MHPPQRALAEEGLTLSGTRPNIVLFLIDDLGWTDVGCFGSQFYETPHIDRLAEQGMRFTSAYANAPNCAPTRACLMSGQYTPRHGVFTVGTSERGKSRLRRLIPVRNRTVLPAETHTLAEALRQAGYATCHLGKWHLGNTSDTAPSAQGFDVTVGSDIHIGRVAHFSPYGSSDLSDGPDGEYLTDRLTDEAIEFVRMDRQQPFFLYLAHHAVHTPVRAKADKVERYHRKPPAGEHHHAEYAAMIESVDESVGRIAEALDELDLSRNTLVVFFSDNGGHARFTSNAPLRGSKGMLYEGGIRVPMIARWPGRVPAGATCDTPVIGIDFFATFVELAEGNLPADQAVDGASLSPLLDNPQATRDSRELYWHFPAYLEPYTREQGRWRTTPAGAIRQDDWKLLEYFEDGRTELYNLRYDVGETNDLAERLPARRDRLAGALRAWRRSVNAPVPTELNPDYQP